MEAEMTEEDTGELRQALKADAEKGSAKAQFELGAHYAGGAMSPPDFQMASLYFEMAAKQNHLGAQFALSRLYEQGLGVVKNMRQSVYWLGKAAEQGHGDAMLFFARRYSDGLINVSDFSWVYEVFLKCRLLYPEYSDPEEPKETFEELLTAAGDGDIRSLFLAAKALLSGDGTEKSVSRGLELLQRAVDRGYAPAQFELARRYGLGKDVEYDFEAGKALAVKAAQQGHGEARIMLETLFRVKG